MKASYCARFLFFARLYHKWFLFFLLYARAVVPIMPLSEWRVFFFFFSFEITSTRQDGRQKSARLCEHLFVACRADNDDRLFLSFC